MAKEYLGDGVYVEFDGFGFILTTEDGTRITNTVYLEPRVYNNLLLYRERLNKETNDTH